jgi:hypothetical protein
MSKVALSAEFYEWWSGGEAISGDSMHARTELQFAVYQGLGEQRTD